MATDYREDLKERNPVTGIVTRVPNDDSFVKVGDEVKVHFMTFYNHEYELQKHIIIDGEMHFQVTPDEMFAIVDGDDLKPVGEYVLGEIVMRKTLQSSFIIIPDGVAEEEEKNKARILHPTATNKLGVSPGDVVTLLPYSNYKIKHADKTYLRFRESEVIALCK